MAKITILGGGTWGIALSVLLHNNGHEVTVWSPVQSEYDMLKTNHEH
ncbi:MAG: glycerol-3-phosphate dehydrogenase, partial [Lachnospiraceae bacterium]|nr:glycerol-3-phosphate dehydrogenase [Lachnospiraceae bacterium]